MTKVIKRDGGIVDFDSNKIYTAIFKAMKFGSGIVNTIVATEIASEIETECEDMDKVTIQQIEKMVFKKLIKKDQELTAKAYESYRAVQEYKRNRTHVDKEVEGIVDGTNKDVVEENSNKNVYISSTQRDLIAGEYSKDYTRRNLLPENIIYAHDQGMIHFHDMDYFIERKINCCVLNLLDMLMNGTVINGKMIEKPKSFRVACTVATQIVQQISNGQYGGQTFSITHLAPFVRISFEKLLKKYRSRGCSEEEAQKWANEDLAQEIKDGVQTIQYQLNTFSTINGQSPFVSIFMWINEDPEYREEIVMIAKEILKQRIEGLKNEQGVYIPPSFPKLLYVLDDNNTYEDSEYFWLTKLAATCTAKRMVPDYISAKIMRQQYDGEVFPCMGCRSFLQPYKDPQTGKYKWYGRFNKGVVTINLVDAALSAKKDQESFWKILDERLELCKEALLIRVNRLKDTSVDVSPIHWKYGGLNRLKSDNFNELLYHDYSSLSLGYAGIYECVMALIEKSHTTPEGRDLAMKIMMHMKNKCAEWNKEYDLGFSLYGTPLENTTYKFAKKLRERFGVIKDITDHNYITNSYHVNVREEISPFEKLSFEADFQAISSGGCISYVESANMQDNPEALIPVIQHIYEHIRYAEINSKIDYCYVCGSHNEMRVDENMEWYCPSCGNRDKKKMNVCRRTCGYLGDNFWSKGRTEEISERFMHIDNKDLNLEEDYEDSES